MPNPALIPRRPEYYVQTGSMFENPYGVPHDEIMQMLVELPVEMAAQVIFGKYVEASGLVFTAEMIDMLFMGGPRVTGGAWIDTAALDEARNLQALSKRGNAWDHRQRRFHTGVDFARQTDFTVIFTIDVSTRPARVVYYRRLNRVPWESIYREVGLALHYWGPSALADSTGMAGDVIFENLDDRFYCPTHDRTGLVQYGHCTDGHGRQLAGCKSGSYVMLNSVDKYPFTTNTKKNLLEHLRNTLSVGYKAESEEPFGWLRSPRIVQLQEELSFYAWDDKGLETDTVMGLGLAAWQGLEDVPQPIAHGSLHGT